MTDLNVDQQEDSKDCKKWQERVKSTIKYDDNARKQYAVDRRYARGDSAQAVTTNLVGTYVDITASFVAAKQPDVDVLPSLSVEPPSLEALRDASEDIVRQRPDIVAATNATLDAATAMEAPNAPQLASDVVDMMVDKEIMKEAELQRKAFSRRQRDNKVFAETMELVISWLWSDAKIKKRLNTTVRSSLTIAVGWMKASWQTSTGMDDPITTSKLHTLEDNIKKVQQMQADMAEGDKGCDYETQLAELNRQIDAVKVQAEQITSQGFVNDCVRAEDMVVAKGVPIVDYLDAPWICHRIPMPVSDAKAAYPEIDFDKATKYYPKKPVMMLDENVMRSQVDERDAETFKSGNDVSAKAETKLPATDDECWVMFGEIWDKDSNHVMVFCDGINKWVKPPSQPKPTTRFYPFFLIPIGEIDNERHPQSLVSRTIKLIDEYNRIGSAETEHRRRIRPKMLFNAGMVTEEEMTKLMNAGTAEYVGVKFTDPNADISKIFFPVAYPQMDANLYNRQPIIAELERIWGIQEALSASVSVAKTATEADIQQQGFNSRTDDKREAIEDCLTELAQYTAELALLNLSVEEVQEMVGKDALWPKITKAEQLKSLCRISIRAGSTGKPNNQLERQSWATLLPQLTQGIQMIGQLRGSTPADIADRMEELLKITAERSGDRLDIDSLVPQTAVQINPLAGQDPSGGLMSPAGQAPLAPEGAPPLPM